MDTPTETRKLLETILKEQFFPLISLWTSAASKDELKGLSIVKCVYKHRGLKRFRNNITQRTFSSKGNTMRTHYENEFGQSIPSAATDILKFKKLSEFPFSCVLNTQTLKYLERWVELKDNPEYVNLMLQFLRSFFSVAKVHSNEITTNNRENYSWYSEEDRKRFFNFNLKLAVTPVKNFRSLRRKKYNSVEIPPEVRLPPAITPKERLFRNLRGSGDFTTWISNTGNERTSHYQSSFVNSATQRTDNPLDYKTSMIGRVLPEINQIH